MSVYNNYKMSAALSGCILVRSGFQLNTACKTYMLHSVYLYRAGSDGNVIGLAGISTVVRTEMICTEKEFALMIAQGGMGITIPYYNSS